MSASAIDSNILYDRVLTLRLTPTYVLLVGVTFVAYQHATPLNQNRSQSKMCWFNFI